MALLELRGLKSRLAGPFELVVDRGECVAVTGPSGAGKSVFLRMIADLDPSEGEVLLDGRDRRSWPAPNWRRQVVYSAAEPGWWAEQVAEHFPGPALARAREIVRLLDLTDALLHAPVIQLSTGERQRLALIRALVLESPVLLLDEPTGALDQDATALVEELLAERLAGGTALVIVTHNLEQARRLGGRHLRMVGRRLVPA
jgi:putative ABC transport system ATP-binding protein